MTNRPDRKTIELKCFLTDPEKAALSEDLIRTFEEIAEWELAQQRYMANYKAEMKKRVEHQTHLVTTLSKGYEYRDVECAVIYNSPRSGLKTIVRVDAPGELVREEPMTDDERQENLPLEIAAAPSEPADGFHLESPQIEDVPPVVPNVQDVQNIPQAQAPQQHAAND